jgi:hypothetical protein
MDQNQKVDGNDTSINVPGDYVGTDVIFVTDGTGPKEVMGGSEHSKNEFTHKNNDMNSNDQYKQGPKTDFGTDIPKRSELEGTDGGNVGTDIISPEEGDEDKSDEPPVLPSNPPPNGKIFMYQKYLESKKQQEEEKKKKKRKRREKKKRLRKNQREIMINYFLLQRTGLEFCNLEWSANFSTMMFSPRTCTTSFKMTLIR